MATLHSFWTAIWPNLAANVAWIPIVGLHHQWVRYRMGALHETIQELHSLLGHEDSDPTHTLEPSVTTINWGKIFTSPQAFISFLAVAVTAAGTAGLIDTNLSGAIQALLVAILGVISAVTHVAVTTKVSQRQALKASRGEEVR